ncbi:hypothetical protein FisN_13Hh139 [Fistulifera solaris]|jgi:hypothetical protein|uniref:DUF1415 domain-containing protein n=1 Tax=Fistulifera solaris TaxID=1519565 RepID=A0A1Z5KN97_FISSO|nr:hypothetical protein FisN_13Hh139 [Fistulifera solaris]|eukprot:GAX27759.1 hypothetical protein FisN_13Hh139 [Fistulifera solaris]
MKGLFRNPQLLWAMAAMTLVEESSSFVIRSTARHRPASWRIDTNPLRRRTLQRNHQRSVHSLSRKANPENDTGEDDAIVREKTIHWLNDVVINMNLCPFADKPMRKKQIHIHILRGTNVEWIVEQIWKELYYRVSAPGTALMVCPELHPDDFNAYLDVLDLVQQIIESEPFLEGQVQVAPFHPFFQFEGSQEEDSDNWTNRSPYPIFHILREEEVTRAVDKIGGDAGLVWKRNVELLEMIEKELGTKALEQIMTSNTDTELAQKKGDILRRLRTRNVTDGTNNVDSNDADL